MLEISEGDLELLKTAPKTMNIGNWKSIRGSDQWNANVHITPSDMETQNKDILLNLNMMFFARQNHNDKTNFSCGVWIDLGGKKVTLVRYNGSSHVNKESYLHCHIHEASISSINRGDRKPEHAHTYDTDRYSNPQGALDCLLKDFNITTTLQRNIFGEFK